MSRPRTRRGVPLWPALTLARIVARDGPYCPHCGTDRGLTVQHRRRRGSGGSNEAERPSNGLALCWAMNDADANDPAGRAWSESMGWGLRQADDPAEHGWYDAVAGHWWVADDAWGRRPWTPPTG